MLFTATIFLQFIFSNSRYIEIKFRISLWVMMDSQTFDYSSQSLFLKCAL